MGFPKALVPFRGKTFLEHLMDIVGGLFAIPGEFNSDGAPNENAPASRPVIEWLRVVVGAHAEEIRGTLSLDPRIVVENPDWHAGQLSSIHAALRSLPLEQTEGILLFLVDHPAVREETVARLIAQFRQSARPIVLPTWRGRRGHPVIFARSLYEELLAAPLDVGARAVVWTHAAEVLEVATEDEGVVLNLNDPEALRRALA